MFMQNNFPAWNLIVRVLQKSFSMPPKNVKNSSKWVAKDVVRRLVDVETTFVSTGIMYASQKHS